MAVSRRDSGSARLGLRPLARDRRHDARGRVAAGRVAVDPQATDRGPEVLSLARRLCARRACHRRFSTHAVVVGTWDIDSDEAGDVVVSALCPPDDAARSGKPIYLSGTAEIRTAAPCSRRERFASPSAEPFTLVLPREEGGGNELRLTLSLNRRFKARVQVTGSEVAVQELDTASPLRDDYRKALPGRGRRRCAGLPTIDVHLRRLRADVLSDFLEKTGLRVHHTFQHNEGMDPVAQAANPDSELWRGRPDYMVLSPVQRFRSLLSAHEQRRATLDRAALEERLDEYIAELRDVLERLRQSGVACPIWLLSHVYTITPARTASTTTASPTAA